MGERENRALFIAYGGNIVILQYPDPMLNELVLHGYTLVEIGGDVFIEKWEVGLSDGTEARLDVAYSREERERGHVKEKRLLMAKEANVYLRHMRRFVVPKEYYKELVENWCKKTGKKYETACEMLGFKEE